ncbi:spore protease YyaC [Paenibacillus sp. NEAU-GSW1]|nr:spore protease YyaC [Paenibacillus sp. NEAU-GSW1]
MIDACISSIDRTIPDTLEVFLTAIAKQHPNRNQIMFICIGTDRSTGDCFGPLVGTMLREQGWPHVIGTLDSPCDAYRVEGALETAARHEVVIAIDACLGKAQLVGDFIAAYGPLKPGQATGANLPEAGNYSIAGIVNAISYKPYMTLQTTPLFRVMEMAVTLAKAIDASWSKAAEAWDYTERRI